MNSDKLKDRMAKSGNAMIYILLALALLGALTMTMMRGNETGGDDLTQDEAELLALQVIAYASTAKNAVDQMVMSGSPVNSLNFTLPSDPTFNNAPIIHKVFHPAGGGLIYKTPDPKIFISLASTTPSPGWYIGQFNNTEWTPTAANDVMFSAVYIKREICEAINKKITGSTVIPTHSNIRRHIVDTQYHGLGNSNFTVASSACPSCNGFPSLCISSNPAQYYSYYSILLPQ